MANKTNQEDGMSKLAKQLNSAPNGVKHSVTIDDIKELFTELLEANRPEMPNDFHKLHAKKDVVVLATEMGMAYNQGVAEYDQNLKEALGKL